MRGCRVAAVVGLSALVLVTVPAPADAASRRSDQRIAEAGLLTADDFPAGWTETPDDGSGDREVEAAAKEISSCKRYRTLRAMGKKQPRAESSDFELNDSRIDNSIAVFASKSDAKSAMKLFEHSSVVQCIDRLFTGLLGEQLASDPDTSGSVTDLQLDLEANELEDIGDRAHAYEGSVRLEGSDGSSATYGLGFAAVQVGRAVSIYSYFIDSEAVLALLPEVVDASVARLDTAVA